MRDRAQHGGWLRDEAGPHESPPRPLLAEHGIAVSLRTVERAVAPLRRELAAEARATVRFETPPGKQMQVDRLQALSDDHFGHSPDDIHWGHVEGLAHYAELLKRITDMAFNEGDHAG